MSLGFVRKPRRAIETVCGGISIFFCMVASLAVMLLLKDPVEDLLGDGAGPALFVLLIAGWFGGGMLLAGVLVRQWDAGRRRRVVVSLVLMAASLPGIFFLLPRLAGDWYRFRAVFAPHAAEYMARTAEQPQEGPNRVRGRCVVVSDQGPETAVMNGLPRRMRAESAGEVQSVVQLRWEKVKLTDPAGAWVRTCRVTILDAATGRLLADHTLRGVWRESTDKKKGKYWTGELTGDDVTQYLRRLPQER